MPRRSPHAIYVESLYDPDRGRPVYDPNTGHSITNEPRPKLGDLAYIHSTGRIISIFNMFSGDHEGRSIPGVPAPLELDKILFPHPTNLMERQAYKSESVVNVDVEAGGQLQG